MGVTIKDVAEYAGVSVCTVSRIINGKPNLFPFSQATRERVLRTVEELGYSPSVLGRGMRVQKTFTVVYVARAENVNHASCVKTQYGLSQALSRDGYCLVTLHISKWRQSIANDLSRYDGLVIGPNLEPEVLENLQKCKLPKVELCTLSQRATDCAGQDDAAMGRSLGEYLAQLGYRTFVFVGKSGIADYTERRKAGLSAASQSHGVRMVAIEQKPQAIKDYLRDHGKEELRQTVFVDVGAVAEVTAAFYIGMGLGLEVPSNFGLASCHLEPPDAQFNGKRLTGILVDVERNASTAGEMLLAKMTGDDTPKPSIIFPHKVVKGETTRVV